MNNQCKVFLLSLSLGCVVMGSTSDTTSQDLSVLKRAVGADPDESYEYLMGSGEGSSMHEHSTAGQHLRKGGSFDCSDCSKWQFEKYWYGYAQFKYIAENNEQGIKLHAVEKPEGKMNHCWQTQASQGSFDLKNCKKVRDLWARCCTNGMSFPQGGV